MRDAYDKLFQKYGKEEFFNDGINNIIFAKAEHLDSNWNGQKKKLLNNEILFIRNYGRNGSGTKAFIVLYKHLFSNQNIKVDQTNNLKPAQLLAEVTDFCKFIKSDNDRREKVQNYQVSHLFGKTKNPLLFTAGWNVAFIPKYLDPFTGHETRGNYKHEFQKLFFAKVHEMFKTYIEDYNDFTYRNVLPKLEIALNLTKQELNMTDKAYASFALDAFDELSVIKNSDDVKLEMENE